MSEHRRESDGFFYKITRFWPIVVLVGGALVAYIRMGFTVEQLAEKVKVSEATDSRQDEQLTVIRTQYAEIDRKLERLIRRNDRER